MGTVSVEIWAWPQTPSAKLEEAKGRITFREDIGPGMSALDLFNRMAVNWKNFGEFLFDKMSQKFTFHVTVVINERITMAPELSKTVLADGDRIVIIPLAGGG